MDEPDYKVLEKSRTMRYGSEAQREAIQEARKRGIFDAQSHIESSPIGIAIKNGFPIHTRRRQ